ncbi:lytic transglycosylase domain-containing protein [Alicyclobacillus cycloheptanicus]|uniref:Soluble lytic murein transglycosylase n=1 Tax=Alicyclobacillus cycloheptanicus TaxID=1457 RepID=A0ABT9XN55_9BACL|nr:lytic transglycosylase domain-containing protein [Alicyclobacillus cycloheptanicus]MDQ0191131.1 soluble lytic murein transglycosylase [Alicyclobacillus cycloheptanicus]
MANTPSTGQTWRHTIVNRRTILSAILLVLVIVVITSNQFWRWMYPIGYQTDIQQAARVSHVDPLLVASVIRVESKFQTEDVSHAGAIGLMQLMPQTAQWIAQQMRSEGLPYNPSLIGGSTADLSVPAINIHVGAWYIHYLIKQFNGNEVAAIAAYNAGPKRVKQWLGSGQWNGELSTITDIPVGETRHFVDRVFYNYNLYQRIYGGDKAWQAQS